MSGRSRIFRGPVLRRAGMIVFYQQSTTRTNENRLPTAWVPISSEPQVRLLASSSSWTWGGSLLFHKIVLTAGALLLWGASSPLNAQARAEAGLFLDYLGVSQTNTDNVGLGGRFGYRIHRRVMLEGELTYSYGVNFREVYRDVSTGDIKAVEHTSIGVTDGLFGPTIEPAHGHLRPFATLKAGFMDFRLSPSLIPYIGVVSPLLGLRTSSVNAALYPAAGINPTFGPLGLRLEFGDAIYFNNGPHNNLRITFGPTLRF